MEVFFLLFFVIIIFFNFKWGRIDLGRNNPNSPPIRYYMNQISMRLTDDLASMFPSSWCLWTSWLFRYYISCPQTSTKTTRTLRLFYAFANESKTAFRNGHSFNFRESVSWSFTTASRNDITSVPHRKICPTLFSVILQIDVN